MKKIAILLAILFMAQTAHAYIEEYTTSDNYMLQMKGFSEETLKMVETSRITTQGAVKDYVPFYTRKAHSRFWPVKWYQVARRYIDPVQDDNYFGVREAGFYNSWFENNPNLLEIKSPNDKYLRLKDKDIKRLEYAGRTVKGSNGIEPVFEDEYVEDL